MRRSAVVWCRLGSGRHPSRRRRAGHRARPGDWARRKPVRTRGGAWSGRARDTAPGARRSGPAGGPSARSGAGDAQRFASPAPSLSLRGSGTLPMGRLPNPHRSRRPRPANGCIRWLGIPRHHFAVVARRRLSLRLARWLPMGRHHFASAHKPDARHRACKILIRPDNRRSSGSPPESSCPLLPSRGGARRSLLLAPARSAEPACCRFRPKARS